jgi:hypothetical protein
MTRLLLVALLVLMVVFVFAAPALAADLGDPCDPGGPAIDGSSTSESSGSGRYSPSYTPPRCTDR